MRCMENRLIFNFVLIYWDVCLCSCFSYFGLAPMPKRAAAIRRSGKNVGTVNIFKDIRSTQVFVSTIIQLLFNSNALGQVSWFVNIAAAQNGGVIGEELQGYYSNQRLKGFGGIGDIKNMIS